MSTTHRFMPLVSMKLREDGRYDLEIDWTDSQIESWDEEKNDAVVIDGPGEPGQDAAQALDAWIKKTGGTEDYKHRYIVEPPTTTA